MTDYFETKSQPIRDELVHPTNILHYLCVIYKYEESTYGEIDFHLRFRKNVGVRFPCGTRLYDIK